jgi:DNA-binding IclR family transcriptional regulator
MDPKDRILNVLKQNTNTDLSIRDVAKKAGVSHWTTSLYLKVLVAEGKVELSRTVGKAKMYRCKK